ncbi:MAG: nucleotidyltransferase family protein [Candidatus Methanomethylicia archaeon]
MIAAIILAAGHSKRFGRNKLLEPINGKPMIKWTIETALKSNVGKVVIVLGFEAERIYEVIKDLPCEKIVNPKYELGMSTSVKCGVEKVMDKNEAVLIIPGDCPFIDENTIKNIIDRYRETKAPIIIATYQGRRGHPILISKELYQEVMNISEEKMGLKEVVRKHEGEIVHVETDNMGVIIDIDTPEDLEKAIEKLLK